MIGGEDFLRIGGSVDGWRKKEGMGGGEAEAGWDAGC